jgi:Family of unknown function (DUF5956)
MSSTPWDEYRTLDDATGWVRLPDNARSMVLAWAAGPERIGRRRASDDGRQIIVRVEQGGAEVEFTQPFTSDDRTAIETDIDGDLEAAGIPRRPVGYEWFIRAPDPDVSPARFLAEVDRAANQNLGDGASTPRDWLIALGEALRSPR